VRWEAEQVAAVDTSVGGEYEITGMLEDGSTVTCHLEVLMMNHVLNPSFEEEDKSMWNVTYEGDTNPTDYQVKSDDAHEGETAFHFWSGDSDMQFAIEQEFTDLQEGTYQLMVYAQGGDMDDTASMELYAITSDGEQIQAFMVTSYADWQNPTIPEIKVTDGTLTIGVRVICPVNSWGTFDEFTLNRVGD